MAIPDTFCKGFSSEVAVLRDKIRILRDSEPTDDKSKHLFDLANAVYVLSRRIEELTED